MKRLLRYLADYKKESILGPLFKMLEASFELFVPLVVASMIDVGIPKGDAGLHPQDGRSFDLIGYCRSGLLADGSVFCGEGFRGSFGESAK